MGPNPFASLPSNVLEFIPERLYFMWASSPPNPHPDVHYFCIDHEYVYISFHADFGPSNLAHVYLFLRLMKTLTEAPSLKNKRLCMFTSSDDKKRVNAAFLMSCYMMLVEKQTPERACYKFMNLEPPLTLYRDAGQGPALHLITLLDCLSGLKKALDNKLISLENLDVQEYLLRERVENGDMNWVVPGKFLAFAGPEDELYEKHAIIAIARGSPPFRFPQLIEYFKRTNVQTVIRLNNKLYDRRRFTDSGIDHVDLYFPDGTNPPEHILQRFLDIVENTKGPFAIHCKAGLGRTGTLIACYLMKHYRFTATEVIGFLRVMRPGSVVGPQQLFLSAMESRMWQAGRDQQQEKSYTYESGAKVDNQQTEHKRAHSALNMYSNGTVGMVEAPIPVQPNKRENVNPATAANTAPINSIGNRSSITVTGKGTGGNYTVSSPPAPVSTTSSMMATASNFTSSAMNAIRQRYQLRSSSAKPTSYGSSRSSAANGNSNGLLVAYGKAFGNTTTANNGNNNGNGNGPAGKNRYTIQEGGSEEQG